MDVYGECVAHINSFVMNRVSEIYRWECERDRPYWEVRRRLAIRPGVLDFQLRHSAIQRGF